MKLNAAERWLVNNPARALVQRFYEVPLLQRLGGSIPGGHVLEIGCGRGRALPLLLRRFGAAQVHGIALDPQQIARVRHDLAGSHDGRITLGVASADHLPFPDRIFDAVFDFGILHHVPEWQNGVSEVSRVLKPGGTFFFEEVTRAALESWCYRTFLKHPRENRFGEAEFVATLMEHGLIPHAQIHRVLFDDIFIGVARHAPN